MRTVGWYMHERVTLVSTAVRVVLDSVDLDGLADETSGTAAGPGGYLARIGACLLLIDNEGHRFGYRVLRRGDDEHETAAAERALACHQNYVTHAAAYYGRS